MKKLICTLLLAASLGTNAQITLEHTYSSNISTVHFSGVGYKYYTFNDSGSGAINIYNLNHSLYQTINTPALNPMPTGNYSLWLQNISDSLFNTSTSNIEYWLAWFDGSTYHDRIYDNAGNLLFSVDSLTNLQIAFTTIGC